MSEAKREECSCSGRVVKPIKIVDDDVDGAADGVGLEVSKIQSFRPDALAGERGVAVHHDGYDFFVGAEAGSSSVLAVP